MVSFELSREIEKDFFVLPRAWGKGKMRNRTSDLPIPRRTSERGIRRSEIRFLMETQKFFFFPRSRQDEKHLPLNILTWKKFVA